MYAKITELEEYYLTQKEKEIFEAHAEDIVKQFRSFNAREPVNIVELGAGDGRKTKILLQALMKQKVLFEYIPIDISRQAMADLFEAMGSVFKDQPLMVHGIVGDYVQAVRHTVALHPNRRTIVLFIGSSIGNFSQGEAVEFLRELHANLNPKDLLLLGCDLQKDYEIMRRAYSDSLGVTRDFNLNLLTRMNRELHMNIKTANFQHFASYNPMRGAMESYLVSSKAHTVTMKPSAACEESGHNSDSAGGHQFKFHRYEPIYLECSHKYTEQQVSEMLASAGFQMTAAYTDLEEWFLDSVAYVL